MRKALLIWKFIYKDEILIKIHIENWFIHVYFLVFAGTETSPRYQDNNYLEEDKYIPGFLTLGQKYSIAIGSTVVLPCKINETGKS